MSPRHKKKTGRGEERARGWRGAVKCSLPAPDELTKTNQNLRSWKYTRPRLMVDMYETSKNKGNPRKKEIRFLPESDSLN